ncbi:hypothetical protein [Halorubellus litoreus]|uniref:Uncharacterized protein n=1 Tax=Halorubellus litoreus TaxID=755308 RepID=A0ABD5VE17_9EURY
MSSSNDTNSGTATETITNQEMIRLLNEPVTMTVSTTLYGFNALLSGLEVVSELEMEQGDVKKAINTLMFLSSIEDENPDIHAKYQTIIEYVQNDSIEMVEGNETLELVPTDDEEDAEEQ